MFIQSQNWPFFYSVSAAYIHYYYYYYGPECSTVNADSTGIKEIGQVSYHIIR